MIFFKRFQNFFLDKNTLNYKISFYDDLILENLKNDMIAMDAGCGEGIYGNTWSDNVKPKLLIGLDMDIRSLKKNKLIDSSVVASLREIPLRQEIFDIIICRSVMEHLPEPEETFREFHRVLKKNGRLIISTQSIYNPVMFINYILPDSARIFLKKILIKDTIDEGTYPAYYRCNSKRQFKRISSRTGFIEKRFIQHTQGHGYWKFSIFKYSFLLFENMSLLKVFRFLRPHIVACYIKS